MRTLLLQLGLPRVLSLGLLCLGASGSAAAPAPAPAAAQQAPPTTNVTAVVERVQKLYEGTTDLHARFTQTTKGIMGQRQAAGEVWLKKPGKMRWDYSKPEKKLFIADGTLLWVYEPEDEQAFKQPLSSSQLPTQVSFLFGKGRLLDDFDISPLPAKDAQGLGGPGDVALKLVPKTATLQYRYLAFIVDPKSGVVKETVVYDQQGGQNRIAFQGIETNVKGGVDDARFRFTPPPGTQVVDTARR